MLIAVFPLLAAGWYVFNSVDGQPSPEEAKQAFDSTFRKHGRSISHLRDGKRDRFVRSINSFPDLASCIGSGAVVDFNSLELKWENINTFEDIDVCVFWVAVSLGAPEDLSDWFRSNGFDTRLLTNQNRYRRTNVTQVVGQWDLQKNGTFSPFSLSPTRSVELRMFARSGLRVDVFFDSEGQLFNIDLSYLEGF